MSEDLATRLRALIDLNSRIDSQVEQALQNRDSLAETLAATLPTLCETIGARGALVRTFSEDLVLTTYAWPRDLSCPRLEEVQAATQADRRQRVRLEADGELVIAQPLDVAGEWFGSAAVVIPREALERLDRDWAAEALDVTCEELDNFLYSIRAAREKHRVMMELAEALRHRVLGEGVQLAVRALARAVALERLLLVAVAQEGESGTLHVQYFEGSELAVDTMGSLPRHPEEAAILQEARAYFDSAERTLLRRFALDPVQEEVLINGVTQATVVGKVVATSRAASFNVYDRELLGGFAEFIRQRVVDFNKEWRTLARSFRPEVVARLLNSADYRTRYLAPREESVAMMFVDISGFTRLSEQVLKLPSAVASLVETWSRDVVQILWDHGGVFDKMVGDCVIGLFGPPFYDDSPPERALAAVRCAVAIREMTRHLHERSGFEKLRPDGIDVTAGVNLAPLFVGSFEPNDNFTGFASGMNNTARLQGCAERGEILVMSSTIDLLPSNELRFGPERSARVKNVAESLRFCPVSSAP
ncbi:MAG TPA: adenylate/guanylate cyclase domain-containing protein [Polyangiaceae bacterium]|nr:adenylate/guanylate cyclase domain-containing protein [Polyangiaceae bacterium]